MKNTNNITLRDFIQLENLNEFIENATFKMSLERIWGKDRFDLKKASTSYLVLSFNDRTYDIRLNDDPMRRTEFSVYEDKKLLTPNNVPSVISWAGVLMACRYYSQKAAS